MQCVQIRNDLAAASRCTAEFQQAFFVLHVIVFYILITGTSCCTMLTIVQRHDKFTAPIREYRLWQVVVFHGKPNRRNPGIAILSFPQSLHCSNKHRVSGIRLGIA